MGGLFLDSGTIRPELPSSRGCIGRAGEACRASPRPTARPRVTPSLRFSLPRACALVGPILLGCVDRSEGEGFAAAVLITLDTTRADALSCNGAPEGTTPVLDALARASVRFVNARASAPLTLPSHASMLTGLYPPRHGLRNNGLAALPSSAETLAERAREEQIPTGAFLAAVVLDDAFGLDQGFDRYDCPRRPPGDTGGLDFGERPAEEVVDAALAWVDTLDPEGPFFLWVHLFDAHGPHEPPSGFADRESEYLAEVAYMDAQVGRLLEGIEERRSARPLVLVVGDHGEGLGEHAEPTHGTLCYDSTLRVPMILQHPDGYGAGTDVTAPTSVVDVYPTLLEGMGLGPADDVDGVSLFRREPEARRGVYFESYYGYHAYGWSPLTGWVDGTGKSVHSSEPEFFVLGTDPGELRDVSAEHGDDLARHLDCMRHLAGKPTLASDTEPIADPELAAAIRSLGYAEARVAEGDLPGIAERDSGLPSPRRRTGEPEAIMRAQGLISHERDLAGAERILRALLEKNLRNYLALDLLGICLMLQDRHAEALPLFARVVADGPQWPDSLANLGACMADQGRSEEALACFSRALAIDANNSKALTNMTLLLESMGRVEQAVSTRKRFLELTGHELPAGRNEILEAESLLGQGEVQRATELLEALHERHPAETSVHIGLSRAYRMSGECQRAIELLLEARSIEPLDGEVHLHLADAFRDKAQRAGANPDASLLGLALASVQRSCELGPTNAAAHGLHGDLLTLLGRPGSAAEAYVRAGELDRSSAMWPGKAGAAFCQAERWLEALPLLQRSDQLQPDRPRTLFLMGAALANSASLEEAEAILERAHRLAPEDPAILRALESTRSTRAAAPQTGSGHSGQG